jgi:hypothetical protein
MEALSKAAILAAASQALPVERVEVPELGGYVFIRAMSGRERDAWEKSLIVGRGKRASVDTANVRARLTARTLCDEKGERLFSDADADQLGALRVDVLQKLFNVAQRLSGVSDDDVEELGKGSAEAGGSGSLTN